MSYSGIQIILIALSLASEAFSLPYRAFSPRSVPGRIRSSSGPDTLEEYLSNYLEMVQQQNLQKQQLPYGLPEYEPTYQQGYLSRRPPINTETIAALLPYLSQTDLGDYAYDYNAAAAAAAAPSTTFTDEEGTWYDDSVAPEFVSNTEKRDKNNQEAALLQLFLDHLAGKYSLEDLETLERQAAIEDNTENQLQALMPHKKSGIPILGSHVIPILGSHPPARKIIGHPDRQGQKEEPLMIPASSVRKPVFVRSPVTVEKVEEQPNESTSTTTVESPAKQNNVSKTKNVSEKDNKQSGKSLTSTMEPAVKSAYEAFKNYLDQERYVRMIADEGLLHSAQKRFVSEPESLSQQLASLKKTVT